MIHPFRAPGRLLIVGPHPDDIELGAGATLNRLAAHGWEIRALVLSTAAESLPPGMGHTQAVEESRVALSSLGVDDISFEEFPVRKFGQYRQDILERLVAERSFGPDLIIGPSAHDVHQDHSVVATEILRAFRPKGSILGYDMPWNGDTGDPVLLAQVTKADLDAKVTALGHFESQIAKSVDYFSEEFIRSLALVRAARSPFKLAERFTVRFMIDALEI